MNFQTSCSAAAQPTFNRAVALLHSFEFSRAVDAFNATLKTDPSCAMAHWGIALSRWGNPFAAGHAPAAQLQAGPRGGRPRPASPARRPSASAPTSTPSRTSTPTHERRDKRARVEAYRDAMAALAATYPAGHRGARSSTRSRSRASESPTDKTYASQLKAGAILEPLFAKQPRSSRPRALHHPQLRRAARWPTARSKRRSATRRSRRRRRTRCTCRRTRSRASATGRNRSTRTSRPPKSAQRGTATAEELHATDYQTYAYLQTAQDGAAQQVARRAAGRSPRDSIPTRSPGRRRRLGRLLRARRDSGALCARTRRPGPKPRSSTPQAQPFPYADAMTHFARALGAAHCGRRRQSRESVDALQAHPRPAAAGERGLLGRAGRDSAARRRPRGWRSPRDGRAMRSREMRTAADARGRDREERQ